MAGSTSTYVATPQPMSTSQFQYSPHRLHPSYTRQVPGQVGHQAAAEEKPPDYDSLSMQPPPYTRSPTRRSSRSASENTEPKEMDEVFQV